MSTAEQATIVVALRGDEVPDLATVDALARLVLLARRAGIKLRFGNPNAALRDLLALCGLEDSIA